VVALCLAVAVLAGCGDDTTASGPASGAASSPSPSDATGMAGGVSVPPVDPSTFSPQKRAFVDAATAICDDSSARIGDATTQAGLAETSSPDQIIAFIRDTYVPMYQARLNALSALTPPPEDGERVRQLLADNRDALAKLAANPAAYLQSDPFDGVDIGFDTYGLVACGSRRG
jgi:hypothetical protein